MIKIKGLIKFEEAEDGELWYAFSKKTGDKLGEIYYKHKWKTWIFEPEYETFFDVKCLMKIIEKLEELNYKTEKEKFYEEYTKRYCLNCKYHKKGKTLCDKFNYYEVTCNP